ncbi:MAG TPA: NAD-dependent epimerase/dehydratase family protein [Actinomycetota bacterium]
MSTYLVTGGAGFIGSHLCDRLLAEGKRVVAVDDLSGGRIANLVESRAYGQQFTFYNVDIRAEGLVTIFERHQPEVVVHLAARRGDRGAPDPMADASVGVLGLLNVLECAVATGARKAVYASTAAVYGDQRRLPAKESVIGSSRPLTPAAIAAKLAADYLRFYERYRGIEQTALVLGSVYGPRQAADEGRGVVGVMAAKMLSGEQPVIFGDGNQTRDFVFLDDAVHAFSLAADRGAGRVINIGTSVETSVNGVFRMLAEIVGYRGQPVFGPPGVGEVRRSLLDNELAERELGWKPWTHLEDGLAETVAAMRHG